MTPVRVTRAAEAEILKASAWYEAKREGLGREFVERVDEAIEGIALNPSGYAKIVRENRRANLRQFPYALWFKFSAEDGSIVVACLHAKRSPALAAERAAGILPMRKGPDPT